MSYRARRNLSRVTDKQKGKDMKKEKQTKLKWADVRKKMITQKQAREEGRKSLKAALKCCWNRYINLSKMSKDELLLINAKIGLDTYSSSDYCSLCYRFVDGICEGCPLKRCIDHISFNFTLYEAIGDTADNFSSESTDINYKYYRKACSKMAAKLNRELKKL